MSGLFVDSIKQNSLWYKICAYRRLIVDAATAGRSRVTTSCSALKIFDHEVDPVGDGQKHRKREQIEKYPGEYEEHQRAEQNAVYLWREIDKEVSKRF